MTDAKQVLPEALQELRLLAVSGGSLEELQRFALLVYDCYYSEDGTVPDDQVKEALHVSRWARLGLEVEPGE